jgi:hypothetical protein
MACREWIPPTNGNTGTGLKKSFQYLIIINKWQSTSGRLSRKTALV